MKGLIQEYGYIIVTVAVILLLVLFGKQVFQQDVKDATITNVSDLKIDKSQENKFKATTVKYDKVNNTYAIKTDADSAGSNWWGSGFHLNDGPEVAYGKWYVIEMEIKTPLDCTYQFDINNAVVGTSNWSGNDNDGDRYGQSGSLKANKWTKIYAYYANNNSKNTLKMPIRDYSYFGVKYSKDKGDQTIKIRNLKTYVAANPPRNITTN